MRCRGTEYENLDVNGIRRPTVDESWKDQSSNSRPSDSQQAGTRNSYKPQNPNVLVQPVDASSHN